MPVPLDTALRQPSESETTGSRHNMSPLRCNSRSQSPLRYARRRICRQIYALGKLESRVRGDIMGVTQKTIMISPNRSYVFIQLQHRGSGITPCGVQDGPFVYPYSTWTSPPSFFGDAYALTPLLTECNVWRSYGTIRSTRMVIGVPSESFKSDCS